MIWAPFTVAVSDEGTVTVAGIRIDHLLRAWSILSEPGLSETKLQVSTETSEADRFIKTARIFDPNDLDHPGRSVLDIRNARYVYSDFSAGLHTICLDATSEVAVLDGLAVVLNTIPDESV